MPVSHPVYGEIEIESGGAALFDWRRLREHLGYVRGALRRHRILFATVLLVIVGCAIAGILTMPKSYRVEAKILAQRNLALAVRSDNGAGDALTRTAAEVVLRRDNLVGLISRTDLIHHWHDHRAPALRARDAVFNWVRGPESDSDQLEDMIERLNKRLAVWTSDGTVSIAVDWPDAQMAGRIVADAQENFLDAKHAQEVSALAESIAILQRHALELRADVDEALSAVKQLSPDAVEPQLPRPTEPKPPRMILAAPAPIPRGDAPLGADLVQLRAEMDAKQRTIDDLEAFRRRRLSELQAELAERRAVYTEKHPAVLDLQQNIDTLSRESPQVTALRQRLIELHAEYDRHAADTATPALPPVARYVAVAPASSTPPPSLLSSEALRLSDDLRDERDPAMIYARGRLRDAMEKYAALRAQVESAQIDLDTAEAAFKYRYSIVTPPQAPRRPTSPNVPVLLAAALLSGLLAGALACVVADLRGGRLVEAWQLERVLGVPLLGEVNVDSGPESDPP